MNSYVCKNILVHGRVDHSRALQHSVVVRCWKTERDTEGSSSGQCMFLSLINSLPDCNVGCREAIYCTYVYKLTCAHSGNTAQSCECSNCSLFVTMTLNMSLLGCFTIRSGLTCPTFAIQTDTSVLGMLECCYVPGAQAQCTTFLQLIRLSSTCLEHRWLFQHC